MYSVLFVKTKQTKNIFIAKTLQKELVFQIKSIIFCDYTKMLCCLVDPKPDSTQLRISCSLSW